MLSFGFVFCFPPASHDCQDWELCRTDEPIALKQCRSVATSYLAQSSFDTAFHFCHLVHVLVATCQFGDIMFGVTTNIDCECCCFVFGLLVSFSILILNQIGHTKSSFVNCVAIWQININPTSSSDHLHFLKYKTRQLEKALSMANC